MNLRGGAVSQFDLKTGHFFTENWLSAQVVLVNAIKFLAESE